MISFTVYIKFYIFYMKVLRISTCLQLDLSGNNLSSVSPVLIKSKNDSAYGNFVINLQNNPFHCDCSLQWILVDLVPTLYKMNPELLDELK